MSLCLKIGIFVAAWFLVVQKPVMAVTIAEQTQNYGTTLFGLNQGAWQVMQELGTNLSGTADKFTFRVSTARTNAIQFDHTALNTKVYDKTTNTEVISNGCVTSSSDLLSGLTFQTQGVPSEYEDVTIDLSCRNFSFITGHRYIIVISNANVGNQVAGKILFATAAYGSGGEQTTDRFTGGGLRYGSGNLFDVANHYGICAPLAYTWNSTNTPLHGCSVFTTPQDDLYFILGNTTPPPPPPRTPVIFIPGIGGSEMKATQDIIWSKDDGHGGTFSHAYTANEKIWVNQDKATELGNDDYFDVLKLKSDGVISEADLSLTGDLTSHGYGDIDSFFTEMGYTKGTNFFVFPYDWRKDVRTSKDSLDALIEQAKTASGQTKVNLITHSMGGLIARYYISDAGKALKVNNLIELGVPHLGAASATKALLYGEPIGRWYYKVMNIGINGKEVKDVLQNLPSHQSLMPSLKYFDFYNNSDKDHPFPFRDERDIDNNNVTGNLNYSQIKTLLSNQNTNMTVFGIGEDFHNTFDSSLSQANGTKIYEIVGTAQPTLGQISETWWITWPINLISKTEEIYINGDDTVPLYSASLKSDSLDISGATKIYYVEQKHSDLVTGSGTAMQTVKSILNDDNSIPVEVKNQKITLEGEQLSLDDGTLDLYDDQNRHCGLNSNGEIEENIPDVTCTTSGNTKQAFVKKKAAKVKVKITRKSPSNNSKTTNLKIRKYSADSITKTTVFADLAVTTTGKIEFNLDPSSTTSPELTFYPDATQTDSTTITLTSDVSGDNATDQTAPTSQIAVSGTKDSSGIYNGPVTVTLTGSDTGSGLLRIEYSLDSGLTVQTYSNPFVISASGKTTIQVKSIDKLGNAEIPQTLTIEIAVPPTPAPTTSSTSSSSGGSSSTSSSDPSSSSITATSINNTSKVSSLVPSEVEGDSFEVNQPAILGIQFENPSHISDQINTSHILEEKKATEPTAKQILGGLLIASGGVVTLALVGLITTFVKPFPK